jgi:hypothetical protein
MSVGDVDDLMSLASDANAVSGGALTPLLQQAQFLGIAGQIGGKGTIPASSSRLSEDLSWTNFHLPMFFGNNTDSPVTVASRRNSRRQDKETEGLSEENKCKKVQDSASDLRGTMSALVIALGSAFSSRVFGHVKINLDQPDDELIAAGRQTWLQLLGFSSLASEVCVCVCVWVCVCTW